MIFRQARRRAPGRSRISVYGVWDPGWCTVFTFFKLVYRYRRHGVELVPREGPVIFAVNHQSHFDPPMSGLFTVDRPFRGFARSTLFRFKPLAWLMYAFGAIPIRQGESDAVAMKAALKELEAGRCVLIFPEGTRSPDGTIKPFKRGVSVLIKRSRATVLPIAIEGAYDVWPIGTRFPKLRGRIEMMAGKPVGAEELLRDGPDAAIESLRRRIEEMRLELRRMLRETTKGKYPAPGPADVAYWEKDAAGIEQ